MKRQKKSQVVTGVVLAVFGLGLVLAVAGMSRAVTGIAEEAIAREPEAILASAGVESGADVALPVVYFDQKADECVNLYDLNANKLVKERQFEWASCDYDYSQIEQGLVEYELNEELLPVATGKGSLSPNRGLTDLTRWFDNTEKSKEYTGNLKLTYRVGETAEFSYVSNGFYPLDEAEFSAGDAVNKDGHNHLWTMSFAVPFTVAANGGESLEITADDDTFVYVGTELALDMGGVHAATTGRLSVNEAGEVYTGVDGEDLAYGGIQVKEGEGAIVRIFHADRDAGNGSVFKIRLTGMNLNVVQAQLASGDNGVQVAYDPSDPSYVGPLGESVVFRPDGTRGYIIMATITGAMIVICAMAVTVLAHAMVKNRKQ